MSDIKLDPQQDQCVHTSKDKVLVVAAAGSGKTRVLTERFKYLLSQGVPASSIVAITFTNMAAEEMRERLQDVPTANDAFVGTIHSFANYIMRRSGQKYDIYTKELNLKYHQYLILRYCKHLTMDKYTSFMDAMDEYDSGKCTLEYVHSILSTAERAELQTLHRSVEEVYDDTQSYRGPVNLAPPPESIETLCKRNNVITFDELIRRADQYFRSLNTSIDYLLVDEFQDVGHLEYRFFRGLNAKHTFYVGDDYQSIYGFKGGDVDIFKNLIRDKDYTTYYLSNNYRNCKRVLNIADEVITQVPDRIPKKVNQISTEEGVVIIDTKHRLSSILKGISPFDYGKYFILTRTNDDLANVIQDYLEPMHIPYTTFKRSGMSLAKMRDLMKMNTVKVLTVHVSKGLEADNVILYGNFPITTPHWIRNKSDERKVMYVGVTRARHKLYILS